MAEPEQTVAFPVMLPGVAGIEVTVTASVCADDEPQLLFVVTETLPLVELAVAVMFVVVDVPDHPEGNVHV